MNKERSRILLNAGFVMVFIGYLTVWLPGPAAGLQFIGIELGEWIKFMGVGLGRNWFYLPPITLALMLTMLTVGWASERWKAWAVRAAALAISLLSFPAIEAIRFESGSEWQPRLAMIGVVGAAVAASALLTAGGSTALVDWTRGLGWLVLGVVGAVLPTYMYLKVRPLVSGVVGLPVGIGLGVWLNGGGHLIAAYIGFDELRAERKERKERR